MEAKELNTLQSLLWHLHLSRPVHRSSKLNCNFKHCPGYPTRTQRRPNTTFWCWDFPGSSAPAADKKQPVQHSSRECKIWHCKNTHRSKSPCHPEVLLTLKLDWTGQPRHCWLDLWEPWCLGWWKHRHLWSKHVHRGRLQWQHYFKHTYIWILPLQCQFNCSQKC